MGEQRGKVAESGCQRRRSCLASQNNYPYFCRLIVSTSAQEMLRIPGKFIKKLGNEIPNVATLITPNGCVCHVRLEKIDGKFCFTDGWHEFVNHHSIGVECLLIFTFLGNSTLRVNIYDIGNAEMNYQCNTHRGPSCGYQVPVKEDDCVGLMDRLPPHQAPRSREFKEADSVSEAKVNSAKGDKLHNFKNLDKAPVPCVQCGYRESSCGYREPIEEEVQDDDGVGISDPPPPCPTPKSWERKEANSVFEKTAKANGPGISNSLSSLSHVVKEVLLSELMTSETRLNQETRKRKIDECEDSAQQKVSKSPTPGTETSLRRSRAVTPQEKVKVQNISRMFRSENPFCRVLLRPSYTHKGNSLHFPSSFAERYLGGVSQFITIAVSTGEEWQIRCTWLENGSAKLTTGWHQFVLDNRLEEGDVCIFELIKTVDIVLKVTIYRVAPDAERPVPARKTINETMQNSEPAYGVTTRAKSAKSVSGNELNG
ncbi:hypothetical protein RHGRI_004117 [Rhododendron griersonianum]|uniref:TF-B3 domain-containing protein n=1 Tax=Rhododendron griersonianum TaxID=479676 RepID=A0AAV6L7E1_9ERIC|nr:hypothetical protein RHGRI_004117 [Rhododendron griersonianum]